MAGQKILIIDDDPRNIFALTAVLRRKGYECVSVPDAGAGISLLESDPAIGIILMDMMMPEMDGAEAIRVLQENELFSRIPVIAVTAQAMVGDKERCLAAGAAGYISKPVDVDLLLAELDKHLK